MIVRSDVYVLGTKWHLRRKLLTPTFNFDILEQFVEILIKEGENMTKSLKNRDTIEKDLTSFVSKYMLNALCGNVFCSYFIIIKE